MTETVRNSIIDVRNEWGELFVLKMIYYDLFIDMYEYIELVAGCEIDVELSWYYSSSFVNKSGNTDKYFYNDYIKFIF